VDLNGVVKDLMAYLLGTHHPFGRTCRPQKVHCCSWDQNADAFALKSFSYFLEKDCCVDLVTEARLADKQLRLEPASHHSLELSSLIFLVFLLLCH